MKTPAATPITQPTQQQTTPRSCDSLGVCQCRVPACTGCTHAAHNNNIHTHQPIYVRALDHSLDIQLSPSHSFFFFISKSAWGPVQGLAWVGQESIRDSQGRDWLRLIPKLVIDDFGSLVEVPHHQ